jgi:hypothetical protein
VISQLLASEDEALEESVSAIAGKCCLARGGFPLRYEELRSC